VRLFLSVPAKASWASELRNGNRIEAVVVLSGAQTVNGRTLPSAVGVWARTRF
jgi:hypothetical protein